jgi:hypothetical protein
MPQQMLLLIDPEQLLQLTEDDATEALHEALIADDEDEEAEGQQQDDEGDDEGQAWEDGTDEADDWAEEGHDAWVNPGGYAEEEYNDPMAGLLGLPRMWDWDHNNVVARWWRLACWWG